MDNPFNTFTDIFEKTINLIDYIKNENSMHYLYTKTTLNKAIGTKKCPCYLYRCN